VLGQPFSGVVLDGKARWRDVVAELGAEGVAQRLGAHASACTVTSAVELVVTDRWWDEATLHAMRTANTMMMMSTTSGRGRLVLVGVVASISPP
jgi:hypothetical protein